eukprot:CAMPEP_0203915956 /NCGR_PEP_ID=MMETSP0359-20131031/56672_1 /ASSEMBLY_ACC=CAM_ASM_000338 /TAXON_ID=268821 /ORGANISM="Scrippsiella Hangoei, Strain SHTV-5" /LENGTH=157 /DNA_ID=CAMNT_0050842547 /DNA_START=198 /DNA_END=671 /DNA_ORIENTATION=+
MRQMKFTLRASEVKPAKRDKLNLQLFSDVAGANLEEVHPCQGAQSWSAEDTGLLDNIKSQASTQRMIGGAALADCSLHTLLCMLRKRSDQNAMQRPSTLESQRWTMVVGEHLCSLVFVQLLKNRASAQFSTQPFMEYSAQIHPQWQLEKMPTNSARV